MITGFDSRILMGTIRILSNGNQAKLILEIITVVLVFLSVVIIILQSYPQFSEIEDYPSLFYLQTSVIIYFTVEYIVRWDAVRPHISIPRYTCFCMFVCTFLGVLSRSVFVFDMFG